MLDEQLKSQILRLVTMFETLEGIELTEDEGDFLKWLSGWEQPTVDNFISIVKKTRSSR